MNADDWEDDRWSEGAELLTVEAPPQKTLWERVSQVIHDAGCGQTLRRQCPACGAPCLLWQGRNSKNWFWTHENLSECQFDRTGTRVHFATRMEALNAEKIFKNV